MLNLLLLFLPICWGFPAAKALEYNNTAGVVFVPEVPVIVASSLEAAWVSIPFPASPNLNVTHLDLAFQEFQNSYRKALGRAAGMDICGKVTLTNALFNITYIGLKNVEKVHLEI